MSRQCDVRALIGWVRPTSRGVRRRRLAGWASRSAGAAAHSGATTAPLSRRTELLERPIAPDERKRFSELR